MHAALSGGTVLSLVHQRPFDTKCAQLVRLLVVLTKIDMVEPDWLELAREDVIEYVSGTFLEGAPVLELLPRCSSSTG